ncbi:MAG: hypothetical protein F6K31_30475 [Symploca sp. SIO2G7]|nr:hypothetical protein [Symploca sp. SIO2G7]
MRLIFVAATTLLLPLLLFAEQAKAENYESIKQLQETQQGASCDVIKFDGDKKPKSCREVEGSSIALQRTLAIQERNVKGMRSSAINHPPTGDTNRRQGGSGR